MTRISGRVFDASVYGFIADVAVPLVGDQYATYPYVDGSLAERDVSIIWLQENAAGTSYAYVDGSLATRDASIVGLRARLDVVDGSIAYLVDYDLTQDASITNIVGRLDIIDGSITYLTNWNNVLDASIERIDLSNSIQDVSIIRLDLKDTQIDASIERIDNKIIDIDASIVEVRLKNTQQDASIIRLDLKDTQIDSSIVRLDLKDTQIDASIERIDDYIVGIDASIDNKLDLGLAVLDSSMGPSFIYSDSSWGISGITQAYVDGSLAERDVSIIWLQDNKLEQINDAPGTSANSIIDNNGSGTNTATLKDLDSSDNINIVDDGSTLYIATDSSLSVESIAYDVSVSVTENEGVTYWNKDDNTLNVVTGLGDTVIQVGQETLYRVYNPHAHTLENGKVVHPIPEVMFTDGVPHVEYANASIFNQSNGQLGFITGDIAPGENGFATIVGKVRDVSTLDVSVGYFYLSADVSGNLTNERPKFPEYEFALGGVTDSSTHGTIIVAISSRVEDTFQNFWNGIFREDFSFDVSTDGTTVWGSLTPKNGNPDMTTIFSDGFSMLDTSPEASINLTAGTTTTPQINYIYVDSSTKELSISTTEWPFDEEHIKVSSILLKTATLTNQYGALKNHNWNDPLENSITHQGHLSHITERIRQENAKWDSGTEASSQVLTGPTPDDVFVQVTSGYVYQIHRQSFSDFDTSTGDVVHIVNHPTTSYVEVSNLNTQLVDANNTSLNNTSFSFVLWGVANSIGEDQIMINLPTGSYAYVSPDEATEDALNYSVYDIPKSFQGTGFLIARFTYTYKNNDWVLYETEDLRGKIPNVSAGEGGGGGGVTTFLGLTDTPSSYTGEAGSIAIVNGGESALEFTDDFYNKTYIDSSLNAKADAADIYNKTYIDSSLNAKLDITDFDASYGTLDASIDFNLENKMPFFNIAGFQYDTSINGDGSWNLYFDDDNYVSLFKNSAGPGRTAVVANGDEPYFKLVTTGSSRTIEIDSDDYVDDNFRTNTYVDSSLNAKANKNTDFVTVIDASVVTSSSNNQVIKCNSTGAFTLTLPDDLDTGFQVTIVNAGEGDVTLDASSLLTADASVILKKQYAGASAVHEGSGTWYAFGNLE